MWWLRLIGSFKLQVSFAKEPYKRNDVLQKIVFWQFGFVYQPKDMGWLRLVGSLKLQVSFAEYSLFYRALLKKRLIILRSLLIEPPPIGRLAKVLWGVYSPVASCVGGVLISASWVGGVLISASTGGEIVRLVKDSTP